MNLATAAGCDMLGQLQKLDASLFIEVDRVQAAATTKLSRIVEIFPHYTSHDISHKRRVLEICNWVAGPSLIGQLNAQELFVLICAIYLHDIGMAVGPEERETIKASSGYQEFAAMCGLSPDEALVEWIRQDHHKRSAKLIQTSHDQPGGVAVSDAGLARAIALVSESHGERDLDDFTKYDPFFALGTTGTLLCLPVLSVLLRISDLLHVTSDRTPLTVLPLIRIRNPTSAAAWAKHISTFGIAPIADRRTVRMSCHCTDPETDREILRLCDYINAEFEYCKHVLAALNNQRRHHYELSVDKIEPNVAAEGYEPWLDLLFELDKSILGLLIGERLYGEPKAAVRELVLNAIDATRQQAQLGSGLKSISVVLDSNKGELLVTDYGIGMDRQDLKGFLLNLGRSLYHSADYRTRYSIDQRIEPLSEFGIGFASCFLVADHVALETKRESADPILLDMYDLSGYAAARRGTRSEAGTSVTLHLKAEAIEPIIIAIEGLGRTFPHVDMPIHVTVDGESTIHLPQSFCCQPEELLTPYFRRREPNFVVERRHFSPEVDGLAGYMELFFYKKNGLMIPGTPERYKLEATTSRPAHRLSQGGMVLPEMDPTLDSLLKRMNISMFGYDPGVTA